MHAPQLIVGSLALLICVVSTQSLGITVPGTKWCGPGNNADNYEDLGSEMELDMCCRAHDNCEEKISPQSENYGLVNDRMFPIYSCGCEAAFRNCLTSLRNLESLALGRIYFTTTRVCFAYGHPIVSCQHRQWNYFVQRCISYNVDESQPKQWQFHDLAFYTYKAKQSEEDSIET